MPGEVVEQGGSVQRKRPEEPRSLGAVVPIVGAAGGALAILFGARKFDVPEEKVAWCAAAGAGVIAFKTTGVVQQLATGLACAGACIGILRFLERKGAELAAAAHRRQADGAESDAPEAAAPLADEAPQDPPAASQVDQVAPEVPAPTSNGTATPAGAPPAVRKHLKKILARLTPAEIAQFETLVASLPPETLQAAQGHLLRLPPGDAVAYLRAHVFSRPSA
jgi:hypothetical protein